MKKTDFEWREECNYIDRVADKKGAVSAMNNDKATFIRYCEMQRDSATRDCQHDAATHIQHVLDDLSD